jgi:hypothetical protein
LDRLSRLTVSQGVADNSKALRARQLAKLAALAATGKPSDGVDDGQNNHYEHRIIDGRFHAMACSRADREHEHDDQDVKAPSRLVFYALYEILQPLHTSESILPAACVSISMIFCHASRSW